jgi:hypothetical protein
MKLTLKIAKVLLRLKNGNVVSASSAKSKLINELIIENILWQKGKHHKSLQIRNKEALSTYLSNQLQINDLENYITAKENENTSRSEFVKITSDSKNSKERAFKGFLVNSYSPIKAQLNGQDFIINPAIGSFIFISDFDNFEIDDDITIVGVENSKNFSLIHKQTYLFEDINPLFVSRYPQNQNKDVIKWLSSIPNNYLHFGDFDIAGIGIYLNEYKKHLIDKATFFIPEYLEKELRENGNRERYNVQKVNFKLNEIEENKLLKLIDLINTQKKGLDQEYYISE